MEDLCFGALCESGEFHINASYDQIIFLQKALTIEEVSILKVRPNCPHFCETCQTIGQEPYCQKCRGDRIMVGNICICDKKTSFDDFKSENCTGTYSFTLLFQIMIYLI